MIVPRRVLALLGVGLVATACTDVQQPVVRDVRTFGDVTTDGASTLSRALDEASREGFAVEVPLGVVVRLKRTVSVPSDVDLMGAGSIVAAADVGQLLMCVGERISISGLTLRAGKFRVRALVAVQGSTTTVSVNRVTASGASTGVVVRSGSSDFLLTDSTFAGQSSCVQVRGAVEDVRIETCDFRQWRDRAVWVVGSQSEAPRRIVVDDCNFGPAAQTGKVRQAIQINGHDDRLLENIEVTNNRVKGRGSSYDDPKRPGGADLISLHRCRQFVVKGNVVEDGGDVGITVSQQSRDGVVEGNTCRRNDSVGICIGSRSSKFTRNISVINNVCEDNGQDRLGDGRPWAKAGILVANSDAIDLRRNILRDTGAKKQRNAISVVRSDVTLRGNSAHSPMRAVLADENSVVSQS